MEACNELQHWGVKGMKWGVRRYQNDDGSLTPAGNKRYARDAREKDFNKFDENTGKYYRQGKKGRTDLEPDAKKYVTEDLERTKNLANEGKNVLNNVKTVKDKIDKNRPEPEPKTKVDLSTMSDKELRDAINRKMLEKQYMDICVPKNVSKGKDRVNMILERGGDALAITSSVIGVALSIKKLTGK